MKAHEETDAERIIRVEADIASLKGSVSGIERSISIMSERLSGIGRPNYVLWVSAMGVAVTLFTLATGALFYFMKSEITNQVAPLTIKATSSEMDRNRLNDQVYRNADKLSEINQRMMANEAENNATFESVEMQDRALAQGANLRSAHHHMITSVIWEKIFGQRLPDLNYYPDPSINPHAK